MIVIAAAAFGQTPPPPPDKAPAQTSEAPPPEVDAALRARASQFLQLEVDGKFNQALPFVASDTKDLFVGSSKPSLYSFELKDIKYSDNFTKAVAMSMVHRMMPIEGFMGHPVLMKMPTRWKIENGQWCYYIDPALDMPASPMGGLMPPGMAPGMAPRGMPLPTGGPSGGPRPLPPPLPANLTNPRDLVADKKSVKLKASGPSADQVTISNISPWAANVAVTDLRIAGLEAKLDHLALRPGEKAILTIRSTGVETYKNPITVMVTVQPSRQNIPIAIAFEK